MMQQYSALRKVMMALMSLMITVPALAQYGRSSYYGRGPVRSYHAPTTDIYYGLRIGLNVSTVNSDDKYLDGGTATTGLNVGGMVGFQLAPGSPVYLETGLSYMEKGGKGKVDNKKFTYGLHYLELPLVVKYMIDIDRYFSVQPFFGGSAAVGVGGKIKDFGVRHAYSSFDDEGFQRMDAGLRLGCGVQYDHLYAELGYDLGLANVSHDYFDTSHTGCFFATIGVNF